jgi:hypothetical protein
MINLHFKSLLHILLTLTVLLFFSNCSIEKRVHRSGFYIKSNQSFSKDQSKDINISIEEEDVDQKVAAKELKPQKQEISEPSECDIIITKDGDEIEALVSEVGIETIRYKRCGNKDGPDYLIRKNQVFMIKFKNGDKEVFKENIDKSNFTLKELEEEGEQKEVEVEKEEKKPETKEKTATKDPYAGKNLRKRIEPLAVVSFLSAFAAIFILGIPLSIVAVVTGVIAMTRIESNEYLGGFFFAILGFLAGVIFLIVMLMMLTG